MPVSPLFHTNMASLKSAVRLTGAGSDDALAIIDRIVQEVRYGFYNKLGDTRINEILGFSVEDNPTTSGPLTRLLAIQVETLWVKMRLFEELPTLFMDSSGDTEQIWNQEGLTREASARDVRENVSAMQDRLNQMLDDLEGSADPGSAEVFLLEPEPENVKKPRSTMFPYNRIDY